MPNHIDLCICNVIIYRCTDLLDKLSCHRSVSCCVPICICMPNHISLPCHVLIYWTNCHVIILCHVVFLSAYVLLMLLVISHTFIGSSLPVFFLCILTRCCYALLTGDEASPNWSEEFSCNFCVLICCGYHLISVCFFIATLCFTLRCLTIVLFMLASDLKIILRVVLFRLAWGLFSLAICQGYSDQFLWI